MSCKKNFILRMNIDFKQLLKLKSPGKYNFGDNPNVDAELIEKYMGKWTETVWLNPNITIEIIEKYKNKVDWTVLSRNNCLTSEMIEKYHDRLVWHYVSERCLSPEIIEKFKGNIRWNFLSGNKIITHDLIAQYEYLIDFYTLSRNPGISFETIDRYKDKLVWEDLSWIFVYRIIPYEYMEKYEDKWNFKTLSSSRYLSLEVVEKYKDRWVWHLIWRYTTFTMEFAEKHMDKIEWYNVSMYQNLPEGFQEKYTGKIQLHYTVLYGESFRHDVRSYHNVWLGNNDKLTERDILIYLEIMEKMDEDSKRYAFGSISSSINLTCKIIDKYHHLLDWRLISLNPMLTMSMIRKYRDRLYEVIFSNRFMYDEKMYEKTLACEAEKILTTMVDKNIANIISKFL